jgi:ABC-type dipeptide/oligopeptide/nickel transport system ATPase subunit
MIELRGTKKEQAVRTWFNENKGGRVPVNAKVIDIFREFEQDHPEISYGCLNGTIKKMIEEGYGEATSGPPKGRVNSVARVEPIEPEIIAIQDMEFPDFKLHRTGKKLDDLFSDHEDGGGLYGGTVNIVIGESGVGKSTVLLDMLASVQKENPDAKVLYVSSEMTRNDILFYYKKTPSIAQVPTLLLMDYVKTGQLDQVISKTLNGDWDIILIDSHQDILVKLKEVMGWKSTYAESWLTNIMIDAAEKAGTAILAIQHMTKGGQYVGSTYLKHATTSMMEILFDEAGQRYVRFSKNRRGGSAVGKRLYFRLEEGEVVYDGARFEENEELREIEDRESIRQVDLSQKFEEIFIGARQIIDESSVADDDEEQTDGIPFEIYQGEDN